MKKYLSTKSIIAATIVGTLITPMLALACVRTVSTPSALNNLSALMARFR